MKTRIGVRSVLLKNTRKGLGTKTDERTADASLRAVVRQRQLRALADALGTIPLEVTPEQLRRHRGKQELSID